MSIKKYAILIAEDDVDDRLLIDKAFNKSIPNAAIEYAENGIEIIDSLKRKYKSNTPLPDLILLDLNMPQKDGRETLKEIKSDKEFKKIPVVIFTTSKADTDLTFTYENGSNSYIVKPSSFNQLIEIGEHLNQYWLHTVTLPK